MRQIAANPPDFVVPVSRLARYLTRKLEADPKLRRLGVSGEISGLSIQPNGTTYFDLKDGDALIKCVAWSIAAASFPALGNGQAVVAIGSVGTYAKKSTYQLTVFAIELEGAGRLHARYEALKRRLEVEGLFADDRKRALPAYPFRVALISSRSANGAGDFLTQAAVLAPHVTIELFETPVQGENAAPEIVRAIDRASQAAVDLVVLARGGGSYEDLFVFNDERVVRALARCAHPTVSAIGHEADAPLTDFVADHRAPTPSTAAQTVLPKRVDVLSSIGGWSLRLDRGLRRVLASCESDLRQIELRSPLTFPARLLLARRQVVDMTAIELRSTFVTRLRARAATLVALKGRLEACNPSLRLSSRRERLAMAAYRLRRGVNEAAAVQGRRFDAVLKRLALVADVASARRQAVEQSTDALHALLSATLRERESRLRLLTARLAAVNPSMRLSRRRERLTLATYRLGRAACDVVERRAAKLHLTGATLDGRDPTKILQRGYAILSVDGRALRDAASVAPGTVIAARLARGTLAARVEAVRLDGGE